MYLHFFTFHKIKTVAFFNLGAGLRRSKKKPMVVVVMIVMVVVMLLVVMVVVLIVMVILIVLIQARVGSEEADGGGGDCKHNVPLWAHILLQWRCLYVQVYKLLLIEIRILLKFRNHRSFHLQAF